MQGVVFVSAIFRASMMSIQATLMSIFNPIFLVILFIVYTQYKKSSKMEKVILGVEKTKLYVKVIKSTIAGVLGGVIATIVIVGLGISVELQGFIYLWPVAIVLMMISPRYICFSYAGGLISVFSLLTGFPRVDVTGLMAIVGVLHLTESFLIFIDGGSATSPVFMENKKYGVVGVHLLQRFWPIPFVILITSAGGLSDGGGVMMPDWWPILNPLAATAENTVFNIVPIVAALGYGDMALSSMPKRKARISALRLFVYSVILLGLVVLSSYIYAFKFIAALFAPIAHEFLIIYSNNIERSKSPIFRRRDVGVTVLEVKPESHGEKMGIKAGDLIISINGKIVENEESIYQTLQSYPTFVWVDVIEPSGKKVSYEYKHYPYGISNLGILYIPDGETNSVHVVAERPGLISRIVKKYIR